MPPPRRALRQTRLSLVRSSASHQSNLTDGVPEVASSSPAEEPRTPSRGRNFAVVIITPRRSSPKNRSSRGRAISPPVALSPSHGAAERKGRRVLSGAAESDDDWDDLSVTDSEAEDAPDPDRAAVLGSLFSSQRKPSTKHKDSGSQGQRATTRKISTRAFIAGSTDSHAPLPDTASQSPSSPSDQLMSPKKLSPRGGRQRRPSLTVPDSQRDAGEGRPPPRRRLVRGSALKRVSKRRVEMTSEEESDDVLPRTPGRRSRRAGSSHVDEQASSTQDQLSQQEREDLEEDLADLDSNCIRDSRKRTQGSTQKNKRQKHLDVLRRRRDGENVDEVSDSNAELKTKRRRGMDEPESHDDDEAAGDDEEESEEALAAVRQSVRYGAKGDEDDQDFIVEDSDPLGVPLERFGLPIELSRHAHKTERESFRDVIEWMVQNKLNPGFARDDGVYRLAFEKLGRHIQGYASSKFISASWNQAFVRALKARPSYHEEEVHAFDEDRCEACGRSNHPVSFRLHFRGRPYDVATLEEVTDDEDEDEEEESAEHGQEDTKMTDVDIDGNSIPDEDTAWLVGRHCKHNATLAHKLIHWRYNLNQWVLQHLRNDTTHLEPDAIVAREGWSTRRKCEFANAVVDELREQGVIGMLYSGLKRGIQEAREDRKPKYPKRRR